MPSVTITKEMLINGDNDVELTLDREMIVVVGEKISSTQIAGYTCETTLEWGVVGEEYVSDSGSYILAGGSAEVVFTNTFTPINPGQEVPDDINLPKTGDESDLALWACAMLLSGAAGMMLLRRKREA